MLEFRQPWILGSGLPVLFCVHDFDPEEPDMPPEYATFKAKRQPKNIGQKIDVGIFISSYF